MIPTLLLMMTPAADPFPADTATGDVAIQKYLKAEVERISKNVFDGAKSKAEWDAKQPKLREQFLDMLGLWPLPPKTDLKATVTGTLERGNVVIENLHFQSKPGLYVTGNLYRPKTAGMNPAARRPAILYVCGHSGKGRDGNKTAFTDHGLWFANNGYVCLVVDTLQLGEVAGKHHGTYNLNRFWWQSRGYTPAGVECWNGIRAIDYLCSRPDVDPDKIGVTGISGGGTTTVWVAAADDRVKVAVPVSGMSDLESYVTNRVINGHCDCMFAINYPQWEWTTILAIHAPKPLLFANSDKDNIFPMDGNRRIIGRLRTLYEMLGAKDKVDEHVSPGGHDYRPDLRAAIFAFFNKHLKGEVGPVKDADYPAIPGKELRVFPEDKDLPKDQINDKADETFVPVAEVKLPAKPAEFAAWKAGLVKALRERSFRPFPERLPGGLFRKAGPSMLGPWERDFLGEEFAPAVGDKDELRLKLQVNGTAEPKDDAPPGGWMGTLIVQDEESAKSGNTDWAKPYIVGKGMVMTLSPRGWGKYGWTHKNPPNTVERSMALLGRTADQRRVWDVAIMAQWVRNDQWKWRFVGKGRAGVIAAYAALFEPHIRDLVIVNPPASHRDGPHFLGVQRVLDIPEALGLLAPDVKLTLIGAKDKAFDKTAAIYKLAGAEAKFKRE